MWFRSLRSSSASATHPADATGRGRAAVADRLRQRGQPGAGSLGEPQARNCRARRAGRNAGAAGAAVCHRGVVACPLRQRCWRDGCRRAHEASGAPGSQRHGGQHAISGRRRLERTHGAFAAAVALLAALLLAATPALRLSFQKVRDGLADGDRGAAGRLWRRLGANMVVVELAIAVVLLAGAGLLGQSLYRLLHVPLGFDPDHLATVRVMAPGTIYQSDEQIARLYREIVRRVSSLPGVESAGMTSMLPAECDCDSDRIHFPPKPDHGEHNEVDERHVSPEYLPTLKATLVRGRFFTEADDASRPGVAVINQALARKYFPGEDPIGQRIADDEGGRPSVWEIVGVVDDVREGPLDVDTSPTEYFPINQTRDHYFSLAVRTRQDAGALLPVLVSTLHQIDPNLGVSDEATMNDKIDGTQAALLHRFSAWLVGGFAPMALVLGVVGLYGVIAYSVSQRTREIGVRMALGAQRSSVYTLVMRQAGWLTVAGLAIGLVCSVGASLLIRNLLFGVQAWDAMTLSCVAVLLGLAAMAASILPARRAASVNPVEALRAE